MTGTWYPPSLGTGGVLIEAQLFANPPFKMTEHDPTGRSAHEPTPPTELIITTEPEFPGQVVWECGSTLGIAPDEATARADAAALAQPEPGGRPAPAPAGEVADETRYLTKELRDQADDLSPSLELFGLIHRAADLLEQRHPTPVSAGMIPVEYWDIDSGARIVSEPSEDGPGGCWVVLNSRLVNPFTEFPTAEAAWDALQAAHALPLPQGEVE